MLITQAVEKTLLLLAVDYSTAFVSELAVVQARVRFFRPANCLAADVADCCFFVGPDFYASSAVGTDYEFGFRSKKIFDSRTRFRVTVFHNFHLQFRVIFLL